MSNIEVEPRRKVATIDMAVEAEYVDYEDLLDFCIEGGDHQDDSPFDVKPEGEGVYTIYRKK